MPLANYVVLGAVPLVRTETLSLDDLQHEDDSRNRLPSTAKKK